MSFCNGFCPFVLTYIFEFFVSFAVKFETGYLD